jgi:hypothetical protein
LSRTKLGLSAIPVGFEILDPRLGAAEIPGIDDRKGICGDGAERRKVAQGLILGCRVQRQRRAPRADCEQQKAKRAEGAAGGKSLHESSFSKNCSGLV